MLTFPFYRPEDPRSTVSIRDDPPLNPRHTIARLRCCQSIGIVMDLLTPPSSTPFAANSEEARSPLVLVAGQALRNLRALRSPSLLACSRGGFQISSCSSDFSSSVHALGSSTLSWVHAPPPSHSSCRSTDCLPLLVSFLVPSLRPHKLRECLPLTIFLRNRLKLALTGREVTAILQQRLIQVDGKVSLLPSFVALSACKLLTPLIPLHAFPFA
jgi:hypothetical protein